MHQIYTAIVVLIITVFLFIPTAFLKFVGSGNHNTKQALNLSAKALAQSMEKSKGNYTELAKSYDRDKLVPVEINKERLLKEFYELLFRNCLNKETFEAIKAKLLIKVVVYYDQFFVAGVDDTWSPPYYFTCKAGNELLYFNIRDDTAAYYNAGGVIRYDRTIMDYGISTEKKNDIIIGKINAIVAQYTAEKVEREKGLRIEIRNPAKNDGEYKANMSYFNVLDGVTFFVVYAENPRALVNSRDFKYKDYNVVGYTLDW